MGASISTNTVNSMIQNSVNVYNTYALNCSTISGGLNQITLGTGCIVKNSTLLVNDALYVSQTCMQTNSTVNSIQQSMRQSITQQATAITQQFSFPSVALAQEFINDSLSLADTISNNYSSLCKIDNSTQTNSIVCQGAQIDNSVIEINSFQSLQQNCATVNDTVNTIKNRMISRLAQTATAKQMDTFVAIIAVFLFGLLILGGLTIYAADSPAVYIPIIILVVFSVISAIYYTATAKNSGNYPYSKP